MTVKYEASGGRRRAFGDGVQDLDPQEFEDWPSEPPWTVRFWCREVAKLGYAPTPRQKKWKIDDKLSHGNAGVVKHEVLSEIVEVGLAYDQLDLSDLACIERAMRQMRLIEECHRQQLEERDLKGKGLH